MEVSPQGQLTSLQDAVCESTEGQLPLDKDSDQLRRLPCSHQNPAASWGPFIFTPYILFLTLIFGTVRPCPVVTVATDFLRGRGLS